LTDEGRNEQALEALENERDAYARILELSRRQLRLAESGDAEELLAVLAEKGELAERAARASEDSRELKASWSAVAPQLSPEDAERGQRLLDEVTGILKQVLAEEDACQQALARRQEGTMEEILKMQKGRRIAQAYGRKPVQDPRFKDERK
jgi:hypothetical protein